MTKQGRSLVVLTITTELFRIVFHQMLEFSTQPYGLAE